MVIGCSHRFPFGQNHLGRFNIPKHSCERFNIAKHSCFLRMCLGKLPTYDRILRWNQQLQSSCCVLCFEQPETHAHLFYQCHYSQNVLQNVLSTIQLPGSILQIRHINMVWQKLKKSSIKQRIFYLCITGITYCLWQERNTRRFQQERKSIKQVIGSFLYSICSRIQYLVNVSSKEKTGKSLALFVIKAWALLSS